MSPEIKTTENNYITIPSSVWQSLVSYSQDCQKEPIELIKKYELIAIRYLNFAKQNGKIFIGKKGRPKVPLELKFRPPEEIWSYGISQIVNLPKEIYDSFNHLANQNETTKAEALTKVIEFGLSIDRFSEDDSIEFAFTTGTTYNETDLTSKLDSLLLNQKIFECPDEQP